MDMPAIDAGPDVQPCACDPDPPAPPSAGVDLPVLTPCPAGWREVPAGDDGVVTCDPWPEGGMPECPPGEAWLPGDTRCTAIGRACPAGDFPDDLPGPVLYVLPGAIGGDGSRAAPFGTIVEALAVAGPGTT